MCSEYFLDRRRRILSMCRMRISGPHKSRVERDRPPCADNACFEIKYGEEKLLFRRLSGELLYCQKIKGLLEFYWRRQTTLYKCKDGDKAKVWRFSIEGTILPLVLFY